MKVLRQLGICITKWKTSRTRHDYFSRPLIQSHDYCSSQSDVFQQIKANTELTRDHLTPEIQLYLVTQNCTLWYTKGEDCPFFDPFWAFYWPGGQAVTRYILDNAATVRGKTVLDVGCGCGASSVAAATCGADVTANDIDTVATTAATLNASVNFCKISIDSRNLIGSPCDQWDVIILGDMFYDSRCADTISDWLKQHLNKKTLVLIGDPGRLTFMNHPLKSKLKKLAQYDLPDSCKMENNGLTTACVWTLGRL